MFRYYAVEFSQNKLTETDPGKKCKNYINTSYNECDDQFIKNELIRKCPTGFMPVWATNNLSDVTTYITGDEDSFDGSYADIVSGITKSGCLVPCTSTKITSVFLDEKYDSRGQSRIDITFSDRVSVTVTDFPKFNTAVFLSAFGGSMGMWLGVGVVQTIEILINLVWRIKVNRKQENL